MVPSHRLLRTNGGILAADSFFSSMAKRGSSPAYDNGRGALGVEGRLGDGVRECRMIEMPS